jgi:hypothetical protein
MDFNFAVEELEKGSRVRRNSWEPTIYLKKTDDGIKCFRQESVPFVYDLSIIQSKEWEIVGEEDKTKRVGQRLLS